MLKELHLIVCCLFVVLLGSAADVRHEHEGKYYYVITEEKDYQQAYDHCLMYTESSKLVIITSTSRNNFVTGLLPAGMDDYYIGMHKKDGIFYWVSLIANKLIFVLINNWKSSEPLVANGDCVVIILSGGFYKWRVTDCSTQRKFICEEDINECDLGFCGGNLCTNSYGSYNCSAAPTSAEVTHRPPTVIATTPTPTLTDCKSGYIRHIATACKDIDECQNSRICNKYMANCVNSPGGYFCGCQPNNTGPGYSCKPFCHENRIRGHLFPDTLADYVSVPSHSTCKEGYPRASLRCVSKFHRTLTNMILAEFQTFNEINCSTTFQSISEEPINSENLETVLGEVQLLASKTPLHINEIEKLQFNLNRISTSVKNNKLEVNENSAVYSVVAFSHLSRSLSELNDSSFKNLSNKEHAHISTLENLLNALDRKNQKNITINTDFIIYQRTKSQYPPNNFKFFPEIQSNDVFETPISLTLPNEVYEESHKHNYTTTVSLFKGSDLFPSPQKSDWVIAASVGLNKSISNLKSPVIYQFNNQSAKPGKSKQNGLTKEFINHLCVFWDDKIEEWSKDGCCLDTSQTPAVCKCNHLTNFAILVSTENLPGDVALNIFSKIGCSVSILSYMSTIIIFLRNSENTYKTTTPHIFQPVGVNQVDSRHLCTSITALLHYTLLTSWIWIAIYSYTLYSSLVTVNINIGQIRTSHYLTKCYLFAYGISLAIVSANIGVSLGHFDDNLKNKDICFPELDPLVRSYYLSDHMCWIHSYSLYCFLSILGAVLVYNLFVFVRVSIVFSTKPKIRSSAQKRSWYTQMKFSFAISTILGINWVLGYLMMVSTDSTFNHVMSWCFSATAAFQGLFTFFTCCVLRSDVKALWFNPIRDRCKCFSFMKATKMFKLLNGTPMPRDNLSISPPIAVRYRANKSEDYSGSINSNCTQESELSDAQRQMILVLKELKSGPLQSIKF